MLSRNLVYALAGPLFLVACEMPEGAGLVSQPGTIAEQCVARAASALKVPRAQITVISAQSVPEGDLIRLDVPGTGTIACNADVDGVIGPLLNLSAPAAPATAAAAAPAGKPA